MPSAKHCCFGICNSDSRRLRRHGIVFFPFPKPCMHFRTSGYSRFYEISPRYDAKAVQTFVKSHISECRECARCQKWVFKCKRKDGKFLTISDIRQNTYICSDHFPEGVSRQDLCDYFPGEKKLKREGVSVRAASRIAGQMTTSGTAHLILGSTEETSNEAIPDISLEFTQYDSVIDPVTPAVNLGCSSDPLVLTKSNMSCEEAPQEVPHYQEVPQTFNREITTEPSTVDLGCTTDPLVLTMSNMSCKEAPQEAFNREITTEPATVDWGCTTDPLVLTMSNRSCEEVPQETFNRETTTEPATVDLGCTTDPLVLTMSNRSCEEVPQETFTQELATQTAGRNPECRCRCTCGNQMHQEQETQTNSPIFINQSSQTTYTVFDVEKLKHEISRFRDKVRELEETIRHLERKEMREPIESFEEILEGDSAASTFYTGFTYSQLVGLLNFFLDERKPSEIRYWGNKVFSQPDKKRLTPQQELIITMVRLRGGLLVEDISYRFGVSVGIVSETVTSWILIMHQKFMCIQPFIFAPREKIAQTLPKRFKKMPNIRVIIDGAEIFCETPSDFSQQSNTYSSYKAHNTFKLLLGCTPTGAVNFVSELYEGSISDREIVIKSGLIDMLDKGDLVLADRGFTVKDLTGPKEVDLRIPAFMHGRDKLSPQEEMETREIARCRIFVEHAVRRLKEFRIFQRPLPQVTRYDASQMVQVCAYLTNFQKKLDI